MHSWVCSKMGAHHLSAQKLPGLPLPLSQLILPHLRLPLPCLPAVVVDPIQSVKGKVVIDAFRCIRWVGGWVGGRVGGRVGGWVGGTECTTACRGRGPGCRAWLRRR